MCTLIAQVQGRIVAKNVGIVIGKDEHAARLLIRDTRVDDVRTIDVNDGIEVDRDASDGGLIAGAHKMQSQDEFI